jgi:hypothetical protein
MLIDTEKQACFSGRITKSALDDCKMSIVPEKSIEISGTMLLMGFPIGSGMTCVGNDVGSCVIASDRL